MTCPHHRMARANYGVAAWLAVLLAAALPAPAQWRPKDTEWPTYTGDLAGTKYRPLDQINASNFRKLEVAWRFKTDNLGHASRVQAGGNAADGQRRGVCHRRHAAAVVALDAKTGELIWMHSVREGKRAGHCAAAAVRPRPRVLDRRQGRRTDPLRHDGLPAGGARTRRPGSRSRASARPASWI